MFALFLILLASFAPVKSSPKSVAVSIHSANIDTALALGPR
jgi:hypothetical protein